MVRIIVSVIVRAEVTSAVTMGNSVEVCIIGLGTSSGATSTLVGSRTIDSVEAVRAKIGAKRTARSEDLGTRTTVADGA